MLAVTVAALIVAVIGARPYASSWNDGSRLATVESLIDRHTLVIDDSIFVRVPERGSPYDPAQPLLQRGTQDKLFIGGHFYSDKPPVSALVLAGFYQLLQWATGWTAREQPQRFCYAMNLAGAGLPYVVAVWSAARMAMLLQLSGRLQLLLAASFAFATVAPAYARQVNGHIQLLALVTLVYALILGDGINAGERRPLQSRTTVAMGVGLGLAYGLDLAAGPLLLLCTLALVCTRCGWPAARLCALSALPPILLHHVVSYSIAGTLLPANMTAEYFQWPGASVDADAMTGRLHHTLPQLIGYALALLFDGRGFLVHNLPLLLPGLIAAALVPFRRVPERGAAAHALIWMAATWLTYAVSSTNHSGACLSIRWFVPWLAPAYLLIGILIRDWPRQRSVLVIATVWGTLLAAVMWHLGPWTARRVVLMWPVMIAMGVTLVVHRRRGAP
jgi:hypothetical protein